MTSSNKHLTKEVRRKRMKHNNFMQYDVSMRSYITIGFSDCDTIRLASNFQVSQQPVWLVWHKDHWHLIPTTMIPTFYNGKKQDNIQQLAVGDMIETMQLKLIIYQNHLAIKADKQTKIKLHAFGVATEIYDTIYPIYHRSPRLMRPLPTTNIMIEKPLNIPTKPTEELWKIIITPFTTLAVTIVTAVVMGRGIVAYIGALTTIVTTIISMITYFRKHKKYQQEMEHLAQFYQTYLARKVRDIQQQVDECQAYFAYHLPEPMMVLKIVKTLNLRIYEKLPHHADFLKCRIGTMKTNLPFAIECNINELDNQKDALESLIEQIKKEYAKELPLPYGISLAVSAIGYIGQNQTIIEQVQWLLLQLAIFHSYHEVQFVAIFSEDTLALWWELRWLNHIKLTGKSKRNLIYHEHQRDQILGELYSILKKRKQLLVEKKQMQFLPHYIICITFPELIIEHNIMELLKEDVKNLGVTLIYVAENFEDLPEFTQTVIEIKSKTEAVLLLEEGKHRNKAIELDKELSPKDKAYIARTLAPLIHEQAKTNQIPQQLTLLELYQVQELADLAISKRWQENAPHKSLAVPLGMRGRADIVYLNLHEKAHGPHGLVAGTTGSGKSEIIQSYIISLAIHFHPYDVAFLLIDYKGGGMANLFKELPHHLGAITNLDGSQSMRALISIKAELERRQRLFGEYQVNHIHQYQKLFKAGEATLPMPHLFLIVDEFAELKTEKPEFIKELVSTARVGRSLGINLILATQKPAGVIDEQIWSNSNFKLCLKVQNSADSQEMLKTPDAAKITIAGRAYLQVGNNEIYELFQSAWSGAPFQSDDVDYQDERIYHIDTQGQYELLSDDLSSLADDIAEQEQETELSMIIKHIKTIAEAQQLKKLSQPWLPPLPEIYKLPEQDFTNKWLAPEQNLHITLGLLDYPQKQAQLPLTLNLAHDGHFLVISAQGFGKSTTLQTLTIQLAIQCSPTHLHIYLLDFGTNGLLPLQHFPHVADVLQLDDLTSKLPKFTRRITKEITRRKQLLAKHSAQTKMQYQKMTGEMLPSIIIVFDNLDALRELNGLDEFEQLLTQISREGAALGIHLLLSATRVGAVRMQLLSNIKIKLALYQLELADVITLVGRTPFEIEQFAGRGLIKIEEATLCQVGLAIDGEDSITYIANIEKLARTMSQHFAGELPKAIPLLPEVLSIETFIEIASVRQTMQKHSQFALGVDVEDVEALSYDIHQAPLIEIADVPSKTQTFIELIILQAIIKKFQHIYLIDSDNKHFAHYQKQQNITYLAEQEQITLFIATMAQNNQQPLIIFPYFNDVFNKLALQVQEQLLNMIEQTTKITAYVVIGLDYQQTSGNYLLKQFLKRQRTTVIFMQISEQNLLTTDIKTYHEPQLLAGEAYLNNQGITTKFKIPTKIRKEVSR